MIIRSKAPLRISFAGGGTDVQPCPKMRGGAVVNSTIGRHAYVGLIPRPDKRMRIRSLDFDIATMLKSVSDIRYDGKLDLAKAVIKAFGDVKEGFDLLTSCDAPPGSGLGSSSALVVALIGSLKEFLDFPLTSHQVAELAYRVERVELKIKGGMQDHYASAFGGFNLIEFKEDAVVVNPLRLKQEALNELSANLLLCNTGKVRLSSNILSRQIKSYEKGGEVLESLDGLRRLAYEAKDILLGGDLHGFGELLHQDWELKKRLDRGISNVRIDRLYNIAREAGATGGKIVGAGGGGHLLLYCNFEKRGDVARSMARAGCEIVKFGFEPSGLQTWRVEARA